MSNDAEKAPKMQIFRDADAPGLMESKVMKVEPMDEAQMKGMMKMVEAGYGEGEEVKILFCTPGFSLAHAWIKRDYPLTRHAHDSDCLYYVVAGSLQLGTETLGPRDGFFVRANTPYTYRAGPDGVEVLEFRHATEFNFQNLSKSEAFYEKGAETCAANLEHWRTAKRPSEK